MKRFLFILGGICSVLIICVGIYILFNVYFVFSTVDGKLYDGFGSAYVYEKPHSPYTIYGIVAFIGGGSLLSYCYDKLKGIGKNKDDK